MSDKTRHIILTIGAEFTILTGLIMAIAAIPSLNGILVMFAEIVVPNLNHELFLATELRLLSAITGGLLSGFGVALFILVRQGLREAPEMSRKIILVSICTWFVIDSTGSVLSGAPLNAVLNLAFLAVFTLPLLRPISLAEPTPA
ncbi:MAG: hypothetical protein OXQ92_06990 [Boseongicola sp.]|nr:hypothetical protein [Boseongicola sp.]MDD9977609.1 hypothetical protein [Boseongicola sp.]